MAPNAAIVTVRNTIVAWRLGPVAPLLITRYISSGETRLMTANLTSRSIRMVSRRRYPYIFIVSLWLGVARRWRFWTAQRSPASARNAVSRSSVPARRFSSAPVPSATIRPCATMTTRSA